LHGFVGVLVGAFAEVLVGAFVEVVCARVDFATVLSFVLDTGLELDAEVVFDDAVLVFEVVLAVEEDDTAVVAADCAEVFDIEFADFEDAEEVTVL